MRVTIPSALCLCFFGLAISSQVEKPRPEFTDYPVQHLYRGKAAPPILTKKQRVFRTMIRLGAQSAVEYSGHYTVPRWGCGAGCSQLVVVDSMSGRVYDVPFSVSELPGAWVEKHSDRTPERMQFRADSRLMKFDGCLNEHDCGFYDYLMIEGEGLKLVRKELLPKEYQD
jgi:hypothetical protein